LQAADNRFVLAEIAAALECSPVNLTGTLVPSADRQAIAAQSKVYAIRQALVDADISEPVGPSVRAVQDLERDVTLLRDLRNRCDYAGAANLLPGLLRELHMAAGAKDLFVLHLFCDTAFLASSILRFLGHPAEAWLGAERCRDIAELIHDPILLAYAAFARACAALACGSYLRALTLAERAADDLWPYVGNTGGLEVLGTLHLISGYASRGLKRRDESVTWIERAIDIAGRTGETTTFGLFFGPTNVNFWRISIEADGGDLVRAVEIASSTNPSLIDANMRLVFFHTDTARACAGVPGREREAIRHLLIAERIAPQHVHCSPLVKETARALLARPRRELDVVALRGLCERMRMVE
jgi:tetratricopeptide (TPR) repeat protein